MSQTIDLDRTDFLGRTSSPAWQPATRANDCRHCGSSLAGRSQGVRPWGDRLIRVFACPCGHDSHVEIGGGSMIATAEAVQAAPRDLVDPRVAKHGGTRRNAKANYDFP